jgi:uncharacterized 2Fe-2S/4Fe-4S cluster protein (DUF4445 family)
MPTVFFVNQNIKTEVPYGTMLVTAARNAGVVIETPCNGAGTCGKCKSRLAEKNQIENIENHGSRSLTESEIQDGYVLACQTMVKGDIDILFSEKTTENNNARILLSGYTFNYAIKPYITKKSDGKTTQVFGGETLLGTEDGDTANKIYGIALDIGTTTMVAGLYNLTDGKLLACESILNPQSAYAQDVLSRIQFAKNEAGLTALYEVFLTAFGTLRDSVINTAGVEAKHIYEVVFSGNTCMLHLATNTDPSPLGKYPYLTNINGGKNIPSEGLGIANFGQVYLPPIISAFVGADITSGVFISGLKEKQGKTLFIDIGTNGEIVMANNGRLAATSTAAGPAFEGMNIVCGMRAAPGAVEQFTLDETVGFSFKTIGDGKATGICGSGLLDIVSELVRTGIIEKTGCFAKSSSLLKEKDGEQAFFITDDVFLTIQDIRQVQLAKGAIRSGITALLNTLGIGAGDIDEVLIAGSFGYHISESSLLNIGLLPPELQGKIRFLGNTSQSGAAAFLLNADFRKTIPAIIDGVEKIDLADAPNFEDLFVQSLGF